MIAFLLVKSRSPFGGAPREAWRRLLGAGYRWPRRRLQSTCRQENRSTRGDAAIKAGCADDELTLLARQTVVKAEASLRRQDSSSGSSA
jgi:hypothetical protein